VRYGGIGGQCEMVRRGCGFSSLIKQSTKEKFALYCPSPHQDFVLIEAVMTSGK
jgi:hypothetical protein